MMSLSQIRRLAGIKSGLARAKRYDLLILSLLDSKGEASMKDIQAVLKVNRSWATRLIDRMAKTGQIKVSYKKGKKIVIRSKDVTMLQNEVLVHEQL